MGKTKTENRIREIDLPYPAHIQLARIDSEANLEILVGNDEWELTASFSKFYTAVLLLKLYEDNRLDIHAPIKAFLSQDRIKQLQSIDETAAGYSIFQLARHETRLVEYREMFKLPRESIELASAADPGWSYDGAISASIQRAKSKKIKLRVYSGTNYQVISEILETRFGSLAELFSSFIFAPLKLDAKLMTMDNVATESKSLLPVHDGDQRYLGFNRIASLRCEGAVIARPSANLGLLAAVFTAGFLNAESMGELKSKPRTILPGIRYSLWLMQINRLAFVKPLLGHIGATGCIGAYQPETSTLWWLSTNQFKKNAIGKVFRI